MVSLARCSALVVLAAATGCADSVGLGPTSDVTHAIGARAVVERGSFVLPIVGSFTFECFDEPLFVDASIPLKYKLTITPDGRVHYNDWFIPHTGTGTAVGQNSATVWTLDRSVSPLVNHITADRDFLHFTAWQRWVSDTGPAFRIFTTFHLVLDGAGNVIRERIVLDRCTLY